MVLVIKKYITSALVYQTHISYYFALEPTDNASLFTMYTQLCIQQQTISTTGSDFGSFSPFTYIHAHPSCYIRQKKKLSIQYPDWSKLPSNTSFFINFKNKNENISNSLDMEESSKGNLNWEYFFVTNNIKSKVLAKKCMLNSKSNTCEPTAFSAK